MTKQLKLRIDKCEDCPYCKMTYIGLIAAQWEDKANFICRKANKHMRGDRKSISQECPLSDAREQGVKVGVAIILLNENNELLVGRRDNASSGNDAWGLPGGGMDAGELPPIAGARELEEETSIVVINPDKLEFASFTNDSFMEESGEHWITLYFLCRPDNWKGEAKRVEPHKCKEWRWVSADDIPRPAFCDWAKNLDRLKAMIRPHKCQYKIVEDNFVRCGNKKKAEFTYECVKCGVKKVKTR